MVRRLNMQGLHDAPVLYKVWVRVSDLFDIQCLRNALVVYGCRCQTYLTHRNCAKPLWCMGAGVGPSRHAGLAQCPSGVWVQMSNLFDTQELRKALVVYGCRCWT